MTGETGSRQGLVPCAALKIARRWNNAGDLPDVSKCFRGLKHPCQRPPVTCAWGCFRYFWSREFGRGERPARGEMAKTAAFSMRVLDGLNSAEDAKRKRNALGRSPPGLLRHAPAPKKKKLLLATLSLPDLTGPPPPPLRQLGCRLRRLEATSSPAKRGPRASSTSTTLRRMRTNHPQATINADRGQLSFSSARSSSFSPSVAAPGHRGEGMFG